MYGNYSTCGSQNEQPVEESTVVTTQEETTSVQEETTTTEESASEDKIVIEDQLGKTIELDGIPQRVATTIMPFPYIFYAVVGNNDNLVGCNPSSMIAYENSALKYMYPELKNADTSFVDTSFVVNVEELLKLNPDVVFQWNYMDDEITKMEEAGIKVVALQYGTLDDLETWIRIIGKMFQKEDRAEELITYFNENVDEVTEKISTLSEDDYSNILILSDNLKVTGKEWCHKSCKRLIW